MNTHVWRVPAVLGVIACGALLLFSAGVVASIVARHRSSTAGRVTIGATLGVLVVATGLATRTVAVAISENLGISITSIDPGPLGYLAPAMFASFAWIVGDRLLHDSWTSRSALLYYAWLFVFTGANTVNRCSPGWCMTVGFPLAWHSWSDHLFVDDSFSAYIEVMNGLLDLTTFVAVAALLTRARRDPSERV